MLWRAQTGCMTKVPLRREETTGSPVESPLKARKSTIFPGLSLASGSMQQKLSDSSEAVQADKEPLNTSLVLAACASVSTQVHLGSEDPHHKTHYWASCAQTIPTFSSLFIQFTMLIVGVSRACMAPTLPKEDKNHPVYQLGRVRKQE